MRIEWDELLDLVGAPPQEDRGPAIAGVGTLEDPSPERLAFADSSALLERVRNSPAAVILVPADFPGLPGRALLRVAQPRLAFLRVAERFVEQPGCDGIHPQASVHPEAALGPGVSVGACAVIAAGARIGAGSCIGPGVFVGEGVQLGSGCRIEANVSLLPGSRLGDRVLVHAGAAIGGDGFGFAWLGDHHHKVPQLGTVEIGDDVEIGCNSCVDRATLGVTRIGRGTKIDNLVQVAHNCRVGEHVILAGQAGLAGSVTVGDGVLLGGRVAVSDHLSVGAGAQVAGGSGVTKDVPAGGKVGGSPARALGRNWREQAALARLPETLKRIKAMERELEALRRELAAGPDVG